MSRKWSHLVGMIVIAVPVFIILYGDKLISTIPFGVGQAILERNLGDQLKTVFPNATGFSMKIETPVPHFVAYTTENGSQTVAGYVFLTTDLEPTERGYDGPIRMLVGLATNATITGLLVTEQHEPYGYFSVEPPSFARQFKGKNIRDPFTVGADVAAVSRATITINSAARAIRNSSRLAARSLLP